MSTDPTTQIKTLLNNYVTNHMGVVCGIISPDVAGGSALLFAHAHADGVWNTQHIPLDTFDGDTIFKLASVTEIFTTVVQFNLHNGYDGTRRSVGPGSNPYPVR